MEQVELGTGTVSLSDNEKLVAMLSHLTIFFGGLIIPPVFWILYKDKSKFVVFHSVQSLVFHFLFSFGIVVSCVVLALVYYSTGLLDTVSRPRPSLVTLLLSLAACITILLFIFASWIYAVYLGIDAYKGGMKKYPIIGNIVYKKVYGL